MSHPTYPSLKEEVRQTIRKITDGSSLKIHHYNHMMELIQRAVHEVYPKDASQHVLNAAIEKHYLEILDLIDWHRQNQADF